MLSFIERITKIKNIFEKYGGFKGLIEHYLKDKAQKKEFSQVQKKINNILKGKYTIDRWGEKIIITDVTQ